MLHTGQGGSISPKGYLVSATGAAKAPFWDAPSEAAEAVRTRTGSPDQSASIAETIGGALKRCADLWSPSSAKRLLCMRTP